MSNRECEGVIMRNYQQLSQDMNCFLCHDCQKFNSIGKTFRANTSQYTGIYWSYEGDGFIIDIHDLFIKKDLLIENLLDLSPDSAIIASFIMTANGEFLDLIG